jgi:hypothetical protein
LLFQIRTKAETIYRGEHVELVGRQALPLKLRDQAIEGGGVTRLRSILTRGALLDQALDSEAIKRRGGARNGSGAE